MTHYPIPGTKLTATFLGAAPSGFSPIYYGHGEGTGVLGSVNAGNSGSLYVGGEGMNKAFNHALTNAGQDTNQYSPRHLALFRRATGGASSHETYPATDPMSYSFVQTDLAGPASPQFEGAVFVDVFDTSLCPDGNALNRAMVYAAPPLDTSYTTEDIFVQAIETTATNVANCVKDYNLLAAAPSSTIPAIELLRLCLYSSNIYNRRWNVSKDKIAMKIFDGLMKVLATDDAGLTGLEFPVAKGEFSAVERHLSS